MDLKRYFWPRLDGVHRSLTDPELRRQSLLLARLLVVLIPFGTLALLIQVDQIPDFLRTFYTVSPAIALLIIAYLLNRQGYVQSAAVLAVSVCFAVVVGTMIVNPHDQMAFAYLAIPMFLSRLLLSERMFLAVGASAWLIVAVVLAKVISDRVLAGVVLLYLATLLVLFWIAVRHRASIEHDRQAALAASERELRTILDNMQDTYYRTNVEGRIVRASESATRLLGFLPHEVVGMKLGDLYVEADGRDRFLAALQASGGEIKDYEAALRHRDGSIVWVSSNAQYVRDANGQVIGVEGTTRDITERRRSEEQTTHLNKLLRMASEIDSILVRESAREKLLKEACRVLVDHGGFHMAWVGIADWETGEVHPAAHAGVSADYVYEIKVRCDDSLQGRGPFGIAMRENHPVIVRDTQTDPAFAPWRDRAQREGFRSVATFPIPIGQQVIGAIGAYTDRPVEFTDAEMAIFSRLASNLGYALEASENAIERRRSEQALRESERLFRAVVSNAPVVLFTLNREGIFTLSEGSGLEDLGLRPGQVVGQSALDLYRDYPVVVADLHRALDGESFISYVEVGGRAYETHYTPLTLGNQVEGVTGLAIDITHRRQAEEALRASEALLSKSQQVAHIGSFDWNPQTGKVSWSRETYRLFGVDPDDPPGSVWEILEQRLHPEDKPRLEAAMARILKDGQRTPMELRVHLPDGSERLLWSEGELEFDEGGHPVRMYGTMQDITDRRRAEMALRQSENNFRALTENANVGILVNYKGRHVFANPRALQILGYTHDELQHTDVRDVVHPDEQERVERRYQERLSGKAVPSSYETVMVAKDGTPIPVELTATLTTWAGEPAGLVFIQDIRERIRSETDMRKLSSAIAQTADAVMITDRDGVIEYVNPAFESMTGYQSSDAIGGKANLLKSGRQGETFYRRLWSTILAGEPYADVLVNRRKDGSLYYEEKTITPLKDANGTITHFVSTGRDITERMQTQEQLQYLAQHDALTELPNRVLLLDRLKQGLARARWHKRLVAVLFVDLDRFKTINDTLGHEAGDRLLQQLADRFRRSVREGDTVARFGGDEFVIMLDDVAEESDIAAVAKKVLETLAPPFLIDDQRLYITASIGISLYPNDGEDSGTLLKHADIAMYRAKELGKNNYQFFAADMSARAFERLSLETRLRHALERNEFVLQYQPQIDVETGRVVGVEALLRWQHPDFGMVLPGDFIASLEETGQIVPVGEWVLTSACLQLKHWHNIGSSDLHMAVNLSPRQLQAEGFVSRVKQNLMALGIAPEKLELEITENMLLRQAGQAHDTLEDLRALGVRLAIDDFGTGYSSLAYLQRFSIDTLKIDRSFVHDIPADPDDSAITTAIAALAKSLKLKIVAEGVESDAQRDFLRALGCTIMQGHLFSRPLPADDITRLIKDKTLRT